MNFSAFPSKNSILKSILRYFCIISLLFLVLRLFRKNFWVTRKSFWVKPPPAPRTRAPLLSPLYDTCETFSSQILEIRNRSFVLTELNRWICVCKSQATYRIEFRSTVWRFCCRIVSFPFRSETIDSKIRLTGRVTRSKLKIRNDLEKTSRDGAAARDKFANLLTRRPLANKRETNFGGSSVRRWRL